MLQAKTKVQTDVLDKLLYADDMDKNASSEAKMQRALDHVLAMISQSEKSQRLYRAPTSTWKPYNEPTITVKGQELNVY